MERSVRLVIAWVIAWVNALLSVRLLSVTRLKLKRGAANLKIASLTAKDLFSK